MSPAGAGGGGIGASRSPAGAGGGGIGASQLEEVSPFTEGLDLIRSSISKKDLKLGNDHEASPEEQDYRNLAGLALKALVNQRVRELGHGHTGPGIGKTG